MKSYQIIVINPIYPDNAMIPDCSASDECDRTFLGPVRTHRHTEKTN